MNNRYIMVVDFKTPHNTGLIFKLREGQPLDDYYMVEDIFQGEEKLSSDAYHKSVCIELFLDESYLETMLKRTKLMLAW